MNDRTPTVTVIVPAYNAGWSVARTLASIMRQSWGDFEVVVVDDGSTDDTAAAVLGAISGDERFRLIRQVNAGVAAARNRALAEARGRYVANLDADDLWLPEFLSRTVQALEARPAATLAFARSRWIREDDTVMPLPDRPLPARLDHRELLLTNPIGNGSAALMRTEPVRACGGWDGGLVRDFGQTEDWQLQLQLAARGPILGVDEPLVLYRMSERGASAAIRRSARAALEVIRRQQADGPRLPRADYWMARSLTLLWLLRRARRARRYDLVLWLAAHAYLRNPVWFLRRELREPLAALLRRAGRRMKRPGAVAPVAVRSTF